MNKTLRYIIIGMVAGVLLLAAFSSGFAAGYLVKDNIPTDFLEAPIAPTPMPETIEATPDELQILFAPFWESWQIVHEEYVDQPVDDTLLMQGAISGMLGGLDDQHTTYMSPHVFEQANADMEGEYDGIGAWVDTTGDYLAIVSPMPGSPAEIAGLKPGDLVIAVDGEDMTDIAGDLVIRRVLGPPGSTVRLTVLREGESAPLDFDVIRAHITVPSIEGEMLENGIAYVRIFTFGQNTTAELRTTLEELLIENPSGIIVDFRNNGGGYLTTAIEVASEFLPKDEVVLYEQYGDGTRDTHLSLSGGLAVDIPLVVLINEGSASASEVVAGAIQDLERGQLVGAISFGKGSVQNWIPLNNEQGAVRITIAKWMTPAERTIHEIGLTPDVEVEMTEEDYEEERDPQLDKAIELLIEMMDTE